MMGLGLIGVGAHAAFTTTTQSHETVSAGILSVILQGNSSTVTNGNTSKSVTLKASTTNASSFTTGTIKLTVINNGTVTAHAITSKPGETFTSSNSADKALAQQLYVCIASTTVFHPTQFDVLYNGKLATAPTQAVAGTLAKGAKTTYTINVYAGTETTACGSQTTPAGVATFGKSSAPSLTNTAEGGSVTVSETLAFTG